MYATFEADGIKATMPDTSVTTPHHSNVLREFEGASYLHKVKASTHHCTVREALVIKVCFIQSFLVVNGDASEQRLARCHVFMRSHLAFMLHDLRALLET